MLSLKPKFLIDDDIPKGQLASAIGRHLIVDYYNCNLKGLCVNPSDLESISRTIESKLADSSIMVLNSSSHFFGIDSISISFHLAESHLNLHTWPEKNYVSFDFFCCSQIDGLEDVMVEIGNFCNLSFFKAEKEERRLLNRGDLDINMGKK